MSELPFQINETEWGLHIILKDGLNLTDQNITGVIDAIIDQGKTYSKNHIIADATNIRRDTSVVRMLDITERITKKAPLGIRLAIIAPHLVTHDNSRFMENAAFNRGLAIRYFYDFETALAWVNQ